MSSHANMHPLPPHGYSHPSIAPLLSRVEPPANPYTPNNGAASQEVRPMLSGSNAETNGASNGYAHQDQQGPPQTQGSPAQQQQQLQQSGGGVASPHGSPRMTRRDSYRAAADAN